MNNFQIFFKESEENSDSKLLNIEETDSDKENHYCLQDSDQEETVCSGKFIENLSNVILYYNTIDMILKACGTKMHDLIKCIKDIGKIEKDHKTTYMQILYNLRKEYLKLIESKLINIDENWINGTEHTIKFADSFGNNKITINIIPFLPIYYLVESDKDQNVIFFKKSPKNTSYNSNKKISFEQTKTNHTLYPVWFYKVKDKIDSNYSELLKDIKTSHSGYELYTSLLDYRATLNKRMILENKSTIDALGKYKFKYDTTKSYLNDPKNKKMLISTKKQGIADGYYSLTESLDIYKGEIEATLAIRNSILVVEKLRFALGSYIEDLISKKKLILK